MSSAANTIPPSTESEKRDGSVTTRPNPVALEAPVSVTGARASSEGSRDLFTEETQTVLVFRDGAVIRLAAPVSAGQLLFLTNKNTKVEVVCQVLRKRNMGTPLNYVELQFTEERPDYWGVTFPTEEKSGAEFHAPEHVEAVKTTEKDPETRVAPHSAEDVEQLKKEVEALRQQLKELEAKKAAAGESGAAQNAGQVGQGVPQNSLPQSPGQTFHTDNSGQVGAATTSAVPGPAGSVAGTQVSGGSPTVSTFARGKEELAPVNDPSPVTPKAAQVAPTAVANKPAASETPLMPTAEAKKEPARAVVGMALPTRPGEKKGKTEEAKEVEDASEELLPKPALDFSKMPAMGLATETALELLRRRRTEAGKKVLGVGLVALLMVLGVVVWHGKMWRYWGPGKKTAAAAPAKTMKPVVGAAKTGAMAPAGGMAGNTANAAAKSAPVANEGAAASEKNDATGEPAAEKVSDDKADRKGNSEDAARVEAAAKKAAAAKGKNKAVASAAAPAEVKGAEAVSNDAPVVPAKLLKAANPVYPPDAMLNYITGDVKAEAVVEANGRVGEVKVLSGPKPLREAAVEALKQYQYEPATQGGRAVASKVTAVVKFWFNP